jgi:hypothetical protein
MPDWDSFCLFLIQLKIKIMAEQNFKNHGRMVPLFHYVAFSLVLFSLVISVIHFLKPLVTLVAGYRLLHW